MRPALVGPWASCAGWWNSTHNLIVWSPLPAFKGMVFDAFEHFVAWSFSSWSVPSGVCSLSVMVILLSRSQKVTLSSSVPGFCWLGSCGGALVSWIGMMLLSLSRVSQARMAPLASPVAVAGVFGSALGAALLTR